MGVMGDLLRLARLTANPPASSDGDLWYRTDTGQVHGRTGGMVARMAPYATHPHIRSTGWHNLPPTGSSTTLAAVLNQAYALPFSPGSHCTLTDMAINITVLGLGNVRGGFYNADQMSGLPTTLVADFGTISTGLAGVKTFTALSTALKAGVLYYAVVVQQGVVATYSARASWDAIVSESAGGGPVFGVERNCYTQTGITGALPASFGTPAGTALAPSVFLKLS